MDIWRGVLRRGPRPRRCPGSLAGGTVAVRAGPPQPATYAEPPRWAVPHPDGCRVRCQRLRPARGARGPGRIPRARGRAAGQRNPVRGSAPLIRSSSCAAAARSTCSDPAVFDALGLDRAGVRSIPDGSLGGLTAAPVRDGTLLSELSDRRVYVARGGQLHLVPDQARFEEEGLVGRLGPVWCPMGRSARIPVGPPLPGSSESEAHPAPWLMPVRAKRGP